MRRTGRAGVRRRDDARLVRFGSGRIVHAVVTGRPPAQVPFDPALVAECGQWTLAAGHTTGTVTLVDPPAIDAAATVGMVTEATTVVEGGTETNSRAHTFTAYLGDYLAFVTVVTDPGSPNPHSGRTSPRHCW